MKILVLNGPNLHLLGQREPEIYGKETLQDIETRLKSSFSDHDISFKQSNSEAELITWIGAAPAEYNGIIINPAALTHTSLGIYDALKAISSKVPAVEIHLSNTHQREEIRHKSLTASACIGQIMGFRSYGYILGLKALVNYIETKR
ncbi:MAG: type II 3-dehydroquinate dehydratase [Pontiellaceae bacterium]